MKHKAKIIAAALAAGMTVTLTGCGGCMGCNGCGGTTVIDTISRSNWFTATSYNGIQPTFIEGHDNFSPEIITYGVSYDDTFASNEHFALDYKDGEYTTEFYATEYDWSTAPESYTDDKVKTEVVYVFKSKLDISVKYKMKKSGAESDWFKDSVETVSYFRAAGKNLSPVYSRQVIISTSPAGYQPATLEDAYRAINVTYENFYSYDCEKVLAYTTENGKTESKEHNLTKLNAALFDNSSLYIAVRSMKLSSTLSQPITLFSTAAGGADTYAVAGVESPLTDTERATFTEKLKAQGLYESTAKEDEEDKGVQSTAVTVSYAGGNLRGSSQTIWYAAITDSDRNVSRATMLKLSVPISFGLGTLNYSLQEIQSTLWNG